MSAEQRFSRALERLTGADDGLLLPSRVAAAVRQSLDVAGASISVKVNELRVPLGASDSVAALAERLQFTVGDGPCMEAIDANMVVSMSEPLLRLRWPALADAWSTETPFRSVVSVPLQAGDAIGASLNLFLATPGARLGESPAGITSLALAVSTELFSRLSSLEFEPVSPTAQRLQVWVAVGIVMSAKHMTAPDALDLLRGHAFASGTVVDTVAARLIADPAEVDGLGDA